MSAQAIYTEKNNCQDCYKCIRRCPVKAIKVTNHSASVIGDLCIYCGECIKHCPVNAKRVRDDIPKVMHLLDSKEKIYASIAPSFLAEFSDYGRDKLIKALISLGFEGVSETAIGAELITSGVHSYLEEQEKGVFISSCCPTVVELIKKYYPDHQNNILPFLSPMLAHGKFLKEIYGQNAKVIFIGPCISKKQEILWEKGYVDVAISFRDLRNMLDDAGILPEYLDNTQENMVPYKARRGSYYPVDGGMIKGIKNEEDNDKKNTIYMSFSGVDTIQKILDKLDVNQDKKIFLELMACEGGCINGPETTHKVSLAEKKLEIVINSDDRLPIQTLSKNPLDIESNYYQTPICLDKNLYSETEIKQTLNLIGKVSEKDELNCGGCGYDSCRDFAIAVLEEKAERSMCVSHMRQIAQNKATALIRKMPSGVVIVDEELKVVDSNIRFAEILGGDLPEIFKEKPGLTGADLKKLISFHKFFAGLIQSGENQIERDVREGNQYFNVSLFTIQPHRYVGAIIRNMLEPEVKKDIVVQRTQEVIRKNMEVVQQIAYLMGENASFTETMLNSILDSHNSDK
ncbi:MAG: [Fe-Fe] hydrogenase large subunit C-terminal domain-containing protein [Bacteroidales bacterium]